VSSVDFDRQITAWLDEQAPMRAPEPIAESALARTRRTRQLPGWATLERWIPMETRYKFGAVPRTAIILVILTVLLATLGAIAVGQQPSPKLPPPLGPAANGLIAFDDMGDIWVVKPDGTGRVQLTSGPEWEVAPVWSEDGTQIAFWSEPRPEQDGIAALMVMDASGQDVRTLVEGLTLSSWGTRVAWSHDGRYLAYSDQTGASAQPVNRISVIPVGGGEPVVLVSPGVDPSWSPDDTLIGYRSGGMTQDGTMDPPGLSVIGSNGSGARVIDDRYTDNPYAYAGPQWSPDMRQLAYHAGTGGTNDIYVAAVDGSGVTAISHDPTADVWPVWSPDGTRIAYDGPSNPVGLWQVVTVDPDGSDPVTLDHPVLGCNCGVRWSPDGTKVTAYADGPVGHEDTGGSMLVIDVSGTAPVVAIPYAGLSNQQVSWQRLAP
jgi:Tol biopolymer transport system component